jgi:hypothetical protein
MRSLVNPQLCEQQERENVPGLAGAALAGLGLAALSLSLSRYSDGHKDNLPGFLAGGFAAVQMYMLVSS